MTNERWGALQRGPTPQPLAPPSTVLRGARRVYRRGTSEVRALDDVDLVVARGDFVAIMGASGSGKSTLLNVLGTLDRLDAGSYHLDGIAVESMDDDALSAIRNAKLGFVFQSFHLLPRYTALENVALPLVYAGVARAERSARAHAALLRVGLESRVDHLPTQLSGGQQQRVAIARALVNAPAVLLADEPTGALDSRTTGEIMALLGELHAQGLTIVMVTHDEGIGRRAARLVRMQDGRIVDDRRSAAEDPS